MNMENIERMPDLPKAFLVFTSDQMHAYAQQYAAPIQAELEAAKAEIERLESALAPVVSELASIDKKLTDTDIEELVLRCGGKWNGDAWCFEDAELHPFVRTVIAQPVQPATPSWSVYRLDDMAEAFDRVIASHHAGTNPFHQPVTEDAMTALRIFRGFIPEMQAYAAVKRAQPVQPAQGQQS